MVKVNYKYLAYGECFEFEDVYYVKTNHGRAIRYEDGKTIHKKFKPLKVVETKAVIGDVVPKLR